MLGAPPSLSLSSLHQSDLSSFFISTRSALSGHPPILPQRAVYESRRIVGNKSSTLQVLVINSVNWTSIIISLQRRDGKRKVWIFFFRLKLFNKPLNLLHLLIIYLTLYPASGFYQRLKSDENSFNQRDLEENFCSINRGWLIKHESISCRKWSKNV